jgi:N-acyl amino acid synthase of PEP-CTERM/exosortase system
MFNHHFQVLLADTQESLKLHYLIRYRVYCLETHYEDPAAFPDKMERDQYDQQAVHFLVREREAGKWVAAMRLVVGPLPRLPFASRCSFDESFAGAGPENARVTEISRLCVVGAFRRRKQEHDTPYEIPWGQGENPISVDSKLHKLERRREPGILLGLIHAAVEYANHQQIKYGYALMAEPLARILQNHGLRLLPIGPPCHYRGVRRPYVIDTGLLFLDVPKQSSGIHEVFRHRPAYERYSEWQQVSIEPRVIMSRKSL